MKLLYLLLLIFLMPFPAQGQDITTLLAAVGRQPQIEASTLAAHEIDLRRDAATAMLFPKINAFGKAEVYNSPTNARPMAPTEVNIAAGESIPFSRQMLRYGLTLDMPVFVKSLYNLRQKSVALAEKARLGHIQKLVSSEAAVVASNGAYQYLVNLDTAIAARLSSLEKTRENMTQKVTTGRAAEVELLKVENSINKLEVQKNELATKILDIRRQLETLTNLEILTPVNMAMTGVLSPASYLGVRIAEQDNIAAKEELERRSNARLPALYLSGTTSGNKGEAYNTNEDFYRQYSFATLALKMPLFDHSLDVDRAIARTQLRKAKKQLETSHIELAALERNLTGKLPVIENSRTLAARSLANSRKLLQVAQVAYESGRTTTEEYLRYESQVLAAQAALFQSENEKWQVISKLAVLYGNELKGVIQ